MFKQNLSPRNDVYGPFVRKDENDKWHWNKQCVNYPKNKDAEVKYYSYSPPEHELCSECSKTPESSD